MQVMFDSKSLPVAKRRQAWRDAICEIYLQVDCAADRGADYEGFVREARFGAVTLTDALISPQSINRQNLHISNFDKDYYYFGIERLGRVNILQAGSSLMLRPGVGALYYANRPYELRSEVRSRQYWIELPRQAFDGRFESGRAPLLKHLDLGRGLGHIAMEFCAALAAEGGDLDPGLRERLGEQFMDILALAFVGEPEKEALDERSVQRARLRSVKAYIDANLGDTSLSLASIARSNGISLRYLHQLFKLMDVSASEWVRLRRLQRCYDLLTSPGHSGQSITEIAYSMGFSSSSHFSNLFRAQFGARPSDVRAERSAAGSSKPTAGQAENALA